jgi:hypothetical protein
MLLWPNIGYAAVGVNIRGTGCSGGAFRFFEWLQSTDGYDVVETIAAQSWVKGNKVGMAGVSYPGITQLFVAQLQPPHLAAVAPLSVISDTGRGILYPGGILNNGFAVDWAADRQRDAQPGGQPWSQRRMDMGDQVCIDNQKLRGQTPDIIEMIYANEYYVPAVADPVSPVTFVDKINVPVFLAGAWQDDQTGGYFPTMLDRFTGTDRAHFTLVNGGHTESLSPPIFGRWLEFFDLYVADRVPRRHLLVPGILAVLAEGIFVGSGTLTLEPERYAGITTLEAARAKFESDPRVRVLMEQGSTTPTGAPYPGFELTFDEWPIAGAEPTAGYFAAGGRLDPNPPQGDGADSYVYDTSRAQRTTLPGGAGDVWHALPNWDWLPLEEGRALAYASDPLDETLVTIGSASVDLWLQSTAGDVDLQATLSEIRPDGQEVLVQSGWLRASRRKTDEAKSTALRPVHTHLEADAAPLPPGEFVEARIELFPFAHVFRAGSRIRISIDTPGNTRPLWKFDVLEYDGEVINAIGRSAAAPSRLVLPVIPDLEVTAPLPPCPGLRGQPCRAYVAIANTAAE